jgi:dipeptidyl aminopeptidase/acylaminoacyl peptidase
MSCSALRALPLLLLLTLSGSAAAQKAGELVSRAPVTLPERAPERTDTGAYARARSDRRFRLEHLRYATSNGLQVSAYLYAPVRHSGGALPAVVFNRGSFTVGEVGPELLPLFHRLASEGFAVLAPLYRGSLGAPGRDEMGGAEVEDLMNTVPLAKALGFIDTERLFLYGESRGGMMVFQALKRGFPARAAATFGAFTDLELMLAGNPQAPAQAQMIWPDFATRRAEYAETRSAVRWAEALQAPLLLMHGGADRSVSAQHALALAERLQALGRPYALHVFARDGHALRASADERDRMAARWFREHLRAP